MGPGCIKGLMVMEKYNKDCILKINDKERILKAAKEKKNVVIGLLSRKNTSQKKVEPSIQTTDTVISPAKNNMFIKLSFRYEGEIKIFPDIQKLRTFFSRRSPL